MGITDTKTFTCDCCGFSTNDTSQLLSLTVNTIHSATGAPFQPPTTYTFCFQNNCAGHVGPIAQYMVQEAAVHHAAEASAASTPTNQFLHPAIEITLADDQGTIFANATSPM